jgi:FKBP-type peptidyl-prolyl cis-trans isomerase 2
MIINKNRTVKMSAIKKKDFVEISFVGKLKNEGHIFDTTDEKVAKENNLYNPNIKYGSIITCVGEGLILKGLDDALIGKEIGKNYSVELKADDTFGKRNAKLVKLVPLNVFKKANIQPVPGLQVTFDDALGIVKTISGGRVIVDFNHPLSGKELVYDFKIISKVDDKVEQIKSLLELKLNMKKENMDVVISGTDAKITWDANLPKEYTDKISEFITSCVDVKSVSFLEKKNESDKAEKKVTSSKE